MTKKVAVRFRRTGRVQYFDPCEFELFRGTHVIVETSRGLEYGEVALPPEDISEEEKETEFTAIDRIATKEDDERYKENLEKEKEAFHICENKIRKHELNMSLAGVDITFDNNKMVFYFTADERVDFRELVKDLASCFRTRIELRQIGVRDETKIVGGLGTCGRELCCASYLDDFAPVTIKMAKDQNLSLNPVKISGSCGRLMCCLRNEEETYEHLNSIMPRLGDIVEIPDGLTGDVTGINILRQQVKVIVEVNGEKEERICLADEIEVKGHKKPKKGGRGPSAGDAAHEDKNETGKESDDAPSGENSAPQTSGNDIKTGEKAQDTNGGRGSDNAGGKNYRQGGSGGHGYNKKGQQYDKSKRPRTGNGNDRSGSDRAGNDRSRDKDKKTGGFKKRDDRNDQKRSKKPFRDKNSNGRYRENPKNERNKNGGGQDEAE